MDNEKFQAGVLKELQSISSILKKMTNQEYCNRALLMALAEQAGLNPAKLEADYEDNLQHVLEQVHPDLQHREIYETFLSGLQDRLRQNPGTPFAG